jgi:hypothetical protein
MKQNMLSDYEFSTKKGYGARELDDFMQGARQPQAKTYILSRLFT